jgi:hypothetical protein
VGGGGDVFDELGLNDTLQNGSENRQQTPEEQIEEIKSPSKKRRRN